MPFLTQGKTNWKFLLIVVVLAAVAGGGTVWLEKKQEAQFEKLSEIKILEKVKDETADWQTYQSPDGVLRAQIIPAKRNLIGNAFENRVEIWTEEDKLLQTADYTSEDGDHGLIVARAEWTPNSQFFIYSAYSSGGHQPWFSRVYFYSRSDNKIYYFREVSGFTVATDEFVITPPDIVTFTVYTSVGMGPTTTKSFELSEIISTLEWKTYRDEEYGFELKYPIDWLVEEVKDSNNKLLYSLFYPSGEIDIYSVQLSIWENSKQLSIKEWIEEQSGFTILPITEISEITVNGSQGVKLIESGRIRLPKGGLTGGWFNKESVYISHGTSIFNLTTIIDHPYFNQILSTFRFIEEDELAGWKSYNSRQEIMGVSLDVPLGWKVNYKKEKEATTPEEEAIRLGYLRINFDLAPLGWDASSGIGWMGWGEFVIDVYSYKANPEEWLVRYLPDYKDKLEVEEVESLGGKPTFLLDSASEDVFFTPRFLVLGNEYSYIYGFSQDGAPNFTGRIKEEILPHINIR